MGKQSRTKRERAEDRNHGGGSPRRGDDRADSRSLPLFWIVLGGILLVGLLVIVALPGGKDKSSSTAKGAPAFSTIEVTGNTLAPYDSSAPGDSAVGKTVPQVSGKDLDSKDIVVGETGTPTAVMFLAHWCPHCQAEVPRIVDYLNDTGAPDGVQLLGVATGTSSSQPNYPPAEWLAEEEWTITTMLDDEVSSAGSAFGVQGYPFFVFYDADGKVVSRASGELEMDDFDKRLKELAAGADKG